MKITAQTKSGIFAYDCAAGENLLYAGLRQGITLPYECGTGTCGTCRARVMEGEVALAWREAPGLAKLKLEKRDILLCQARAGSDCVVRVPSANVAHSNTPIGPFQTTVPALSTRAT